jgi:hypothetical protein
MAKTGKAAKGAAGHWRVGVMESTPQDFLLAFQQEVLRL